MEAEDPLANLADIHLPGAVSFWPPAPGWWVLALILVIGLVYAGILYFRHWQQQRRLDMALQALARVYETYNRQTKPGTSHNEAGLLFLAGCNEILKRVALTHFPHQDVAGLTGNRWLGFLDQTGGGTAFSQGEGKILGDGGYRKEFTGNVDVIYRLASQWIRLRYCKPTTQAKPASQREQAA